MFGDKPKKRIVFFILITAAIFVVSINVIYYLFGHRAIEYLYNEPTKGLFKNKIEGQSSYPLDYYWSTVDKDVIRFNIFVGLYFIGSLIIIYGIKKDLTKKFLLNLLWIDVCFLILHSEQSPFWSILGDRHIPEIFQYLQELFISVLFLLFFRKTKQKIFGWCSIVFFYIFIDDSLSLHENFSFVLFKNVDLSLISSWFDSKIQFFTDAMFFGVIGTIFIFVFFFISIKSNFSSRRIARNILGLIFLLAFFGVVVDTVNEVFFTADTHYFFPLEDWGEIVVTSVICFYALRSFIQYKAIKE